MAVRTSPAGGPASHEYPADGVGRAEGVSGNVLRQALEWQVTFWSGEVTPGERAAFDRWLAARAEHARAWAEVQHTDDRLKTLAASAVGEALRSASSARRAATRRQALRVMGLFAGIGVAAYAARGTEPVQSFMADHRSGAGERRELSLPDGTRVMLAAQSALDVRFSAQLREVRLLSGEIFVATAADPDAVAGRPSRPFIVRTAQGTVRAIGTRFTVRQGQGRSLVSVQQGAVEVRPAADAADSVRVDAGARAWFSGDSVLAPQAAEPGDAAWTRGLMVAERMRLEDFLAELGRYRSGMLRCDPAVRDLVVSGVYPLDDTELALSTLAQALPVRIDRVTRYWVTVRPRVR